jgi:hypothetical protein
VTCLSKWLIEFRILISFSFNFNNRFLTNKLNGTAYFTLF